MSAVDRPWWASDDDGLDPAVDPVEAHRGARRGGGDDPADDGSWWVPATEAVTRLARDLAGGGHVPGNGPRGDEPRTDGGTHRIDACGVCPICVGLRALGEARPDLVGHLAEAARQLALAVRTVVDAATEGGDAPRDATGEGAARRRSETLQRIDLDG